MSHMPATILIVDDEKNTREGLSIALEEEYDVYMASGADEAFNLMEAETFDIVLTDLRMAGKSGLKVIDRAITLPNRPICIMMTAYGNVETAVEAMRRGAFDFLTKPVSLEKLEILIKRALQSRQIEAENVVLHERLDKKYSFDGIVGDSPGLIDVLDKVKLVAPSKATVLLEGETGTGKELIAQAIHQNSNRARQAFVPVHCAALAANLLESELFGHEKGAYTGATERRIGRFEAAGGGTLFLDEIGEIDSATQVKLLRFLETRSFERLGSSKPIQVDVRLVLHTDLSCPKPGATPAGRSRGAAQRVTAPNLLASCHPHCGTGFRVCVLHHLHAGSCDAAVLIADAPRRESASGHGIWSTPKVEGRHTSSVAQSPGCIVVTLMPVPTSSRRVPSDSASTKYFDAQYTWQVRILERTAPASKRCRIGTVRATPPRSAATFSLTRATSMKRHHSGAGGGFVVHRPRGSGTPGGQHRKISSRCGPIHARSCL